MKLISHRGNVVGRMESWENEPTYIDLAISKGYDVEVDAWYKDNIMWLGHDEPMYHPFGGIGFFYERREKLWIHCKNHEAIEYFSKQYHKEHHTYNFFWHQNDDITLTSKGYIWAYPGKQPIKDSIAVMPEYFDDDVSQCIAICSDVIEKYKK